MKQKIIGLSQRYVAALRKFLKPEACASRQPAMRLGRQAVALGLETLELARIHERAFATLRLSNSRNGVLKRAEFFFTEANTAIEETHRAARQRKTDLIRLIKTPGQRTKELAASHRQWQRGVVRDKAREDASEQGGKSHHKCLAESRQLQRRLRQSMHRALEAQEKERYQISHDLQDEIAQTRLGIHARLLALKRAARSNSKGLKNAIASAQRLVVKSARFVRRFVRKLDAPDPIPGARSILAL